MEFESRIIEFLEKIYYNELLKASKEETPLVIDFNDFDRFDPILASQLLDDSENVFEMFKNAIEKIDKPFEYNPRIMVKHLPEKRNIRIRNLRAKHLGKLWSIDAIIKSATEVKPQIYEVVFECPECSAKIPVQQDSTVIKGPDICKCGR